MEARPQKFDIGEIVYEPYAPQKYGRVIEFGYPTDPSEFARFSGIGFYLVRWKDGSEVLVWELNLKSLDALVRDHEKKIETHKRNIEKARQL